MSRELITRRVEAFKSEAGANPAQFEDCVMNRDSLGAIPSWKNFPRGVWSREFGRSGLKLARKFC